MKHTKTVIKGKEKTVIKITLDDECNNGHADFAITCDIYEKRRNGRYVDIGGGAAHDHILSIAPEFKLFVDLHLSAFDGVPMYAIENGFYHAKDSEKTYLQRIDTVARHMRCSLSEAEKLCSAEDKDVFHYYVENMDLPTRWQKEANEAIKQLEKLTGKSFDRSKAGVSRYEPLPSDRVITINNRIDSNYYTEEEVEKRRVEAVEKEAENRIAKMRAEAEKKIKSTERELSIAIVLERAFCKLRIANPDFILTKSDWIYYSHSNVIRFGWNKPCNHADYLLVLESIDSADKEWLPDFENKVY